MTTRYQEIAAKWARTTEPRDAEYSAFVVAELARDNANHASRVRVAELAVSRGNYTEEGRQVWRDFLAAGAPRNWTVPGA